MLTAATRPTAPSPLFGTAASLRMSRCAGAEVATTYPPIATKAICIVKVIRLQKPSPKAWLTFSGDAPLAKAAIATITTATATKTKASGNQRSAQAVNAIAIRTRTRSWWPLRSGVAPAFVNVACDIANPPTRRSALLLVNARQW